jgi:uncharacterized FlaG/YvyC family protein
MTKNSQKSNKNQQNKKIKKLQKMRMGVKKSDEKLNFFYKSKWKLLVLVIVDKI